MGNHALRKQAAQLIKERGIQSKLYKNKKAARKLLNASRLREIIRKLSVKPGDLVGDCDGTNHIIKDYYAREHMGDDTFKVQMKIWHYNKKASGYFFEVPQYVFEDERYSCGCSDSPDSPYSREEIEANLLSYTEEEIALWREQGWWKESDDKRREHLLSGGHIVDERGIRIPAWYPSY